MAAIAMTKDLKLMMARLTPLFKRRRQTRYWLSLVNQTYTPAYNFFMNVQPKDQRQRSIPLHSLINYDLADLETFIGCFVSTRNSRLNMSALKRCAGLNQIG